MNTRVYKTTILILAFAVMWLGWKYFSLSGKMMAAGFVSYQARTLRTDIDPANAEFADRKGILHDLDWYLAYYDGHTNTLARSEVLYLLRIERDYIVRDAIAYLRKTGTNDFGDDPYEWLRHEYAR